MLDNITILSRRCWRSRQRQHSTVDGGDSFFLAELLPPQHNSFSSSYGKFSP